MISLKIEAIGFKELQNALTQVARAAPIIVHPELRNLGEELRDKVKEEIRGNNYRWHGDLLNSVGVDDVSDKEVDVVEDGSLGKWIRYGTQGSNKKPPPDSDLIDWCVTKLGLRDRRDVYKTALAIRRKGTLAESRKHYPDNWRGFDYPEKVVNENQALIQQYADRMGGLLVKYLDVHTK